MKKIPTIFQRNPDNMKELLEVPHLDCGWVFNGEGVATRKYDGTCCMVKDGRLYKRREYKSGKTIPGVFMEVDHDDITGKTVGWVPVTDGPEDKWHLEAFRGDEADGTYELIGPKVQGNPEKYVHHLLIGHSEAIEFAAVPRTFLGIKEWFEGFDIEGLVFHHPDGRMAKIKKRDYGMARIAN